MSDTKTFYLYHLRAPSTSSGLGYDGYHGITGRAPKQRFQEHMRACASGRHPNTKVQELYDHARGQLQCHVARSGSEESILASEGLLVRRAGMHANIQAGGGRLRGRTQDDLVDLLYGKKRRADKNEGGNPGAHAETGAARSGGGQAAALVLVGTLIVSGIVYLLYRRNGGDATPAAASPHALDVEQTSRSNLKVGTAVRSGRNWSGQLLKVASVLFEGFVDLRYGRRGPR